MTQLLNITQQFMSYNASKGTTDNPALRNFDWTRRIYSIPIANTKNDTIVIPPFESVSLFSGFRNHGLLAGDTAKLIGFDDSIYRLVVTSGAANFRTKRAVTGITTCDISINNNSIAIFDFAGASLTGVVAGDILRLKGYNTKDSSAIFNPVNTGDWVILSVNGDKLTCKRPINEDFVAVEETLASIAYDTDIIIFSPNGIQKDDTVKLNNWLVFGTMTFKVQDVTPDTIEFVSGEPLPIDVEYPYALNALQFYSNSKRFLYLEVNKSVAVLLNGSTDESNVVDPIDPTDAEMPGFFSKFGSMQSCVLVNKTLEPATVTFCTAE